jgi:hypothetical protein
MSSNYNIQIVKKQDFKKTGAKRTHFSITKKNETMISIDDIEAIYQQFLSSGIQAEHIGLVGLNAERFTTIKSLFSDELFNYFEDDYLDGKSHAVKEKLSNFFNLQVIIYK